MRVTVTRSFHTYKIVLIAVILSFICEPSKGQQKELDSLIKKFDSYRINFPQEKIYVHLDRKLYLTGETIWFKIYYVDGVLNRPLNISKVAYLEILDKDNQAVVQTKVALNDGEGNGSLFLPASINAGNFTVRAYTNWMKNFNPEYFFHTPITILNTFRKPELEKIPVSKFNAQFFPEGGNLVYGLKSKVAFQALDSQGKGINFSGFILNQKNDTLSSIKPLKYGIGNFTFTPLYGDSYRAVLLDTLGRSQTFTLPVPLEQGYVMEAKDSTTDLLVVNVTSALRNTSSPPVVYFFIHARQIITAAQMQFVRSGKATLVINKKELSEGVSHITIFDGDLRPQCERLYFKASENKLQIEAHVNQREYGLRRKVILNISAHQNTPEKDASLSVAVVKTDSLQPNLAGNIFPYLWLASDLTGEIESPEYYSSSQSPEVALATDNLMLTHGWRRFTWNDVLEKKKNEVIFLPEYRGHLIRGTVLGLNGSKAGGVLTYLSTPGKNVQLYGARSDSYGDVHYEMKDFWGLKKIIVQMNTEQDSTNQIKILSPFSDAYAIRKLSPLQLVPEVEKSLISRSIAMQVQDIFYSEDNRFSISQIDSTAFYGKADETYFLDDYTRFTVMEEVMREYVPGVLVRKRKGRFHFMVLDLVKKTVFQENPLILLDGIPVFDVDKIMQFDPLKVKKLEVLTRKYFLGPLIFPGIVSYTTYTGDLAGFPVDLKSVSLDYEGLQRQRTFYSPQYDNQKQRESRMPDRRNLMFWAPQVILDKDGKQQLEFYTSDLTGDYTIVVEGIAKNGASGSATHSFTVKQFNN